MAGLEVLAALVAFTNCTAGQMMHIYLVCFASKNQAMVGSSNLSSNQDRGIKQAPLVAEQVHIAVVAIQATQVAASLMALDFNR